MNQHIRFGTHGSALHSKGWNIIPIPASSKAPCIEGWTAGFSKQQVDAFAANGYAQGNIGLLARLFPAVDIDVLDEECATAIEQHALQTLGPAPVRFGNRPKRLLAYRTETPFKKLKTYLTAPDGKDYAVEILGDGQQYIIYGKHPDGFDYEWPVHGGLVTVSPTSLSLVDKDAVANFLVTLPMALPAGWNVRDAAGKHRGKSKSGLAPIFENLRLPLPDWPLDRIVGELLSCLDPDVGHDEWLHIGMGLHHQGQGDEAYLAAWIDWSAMSNKFKEGECEDRWGSFSAQGDGIQAPVTLATLIKAAGAARTSKVTASRKKIESRIDASSDFDELTKEILKEVFEASLPEADTCLRIKKISHKTKVSPKSLTQDGAQYRRVGATNQQMHLNAARAVLDLLGKENLLFSQGGLWRWSEAGVWTPMQDREVKLLIHKIAANTKLTTNVVNSILDMVKTEVHHGNVVFDHPSDAINCRNGELHYEDWLGGWLLQPHVREHFRTAQIPLNYNPNAKAPRFEQFLDEVFAGDSDARQKRLVVEEALGYTLLASCRLEKFLMLIGGGANGKSVLLTVVAALVGTNQVSAVQPSQFDNRFQRAHLVGKLANIVTEIAQGAEIADDKLKSLVSGELTTAEMKFKDPFDFKPFATHWFGTNHLPRTRDFSDALFRRAILLSFNNRFEGDKRDVGLTDKLLAELPGIFNIALRGLARLLEHGRFTECPSSDAIKASWQMETDQVRQYVEAYCVIDAHARVSSKSLFRSYRSWATEVGIRGTLSQNTFSSRLQALGFKPHRGAQGERQVVGLKVSSFDFLD